MSDLALRSANELYESGLDHGRALLAAEYHAVGEDGTRRRLPFERWLRRAADEEEQLLQWATGPVLDVGCGVGRHLTALGRRGVAATGVEISPRAVQIARARGAEVLEGSIFDHPTAGGWGSALLLDGNIGIGGDPERLLAPGCRAAAPRRQRPGRARPAAQRDADAAAAAGGPARRQRLDPLGLGRG